MQAAVDPARRWPKRLLVALAAWFVLCLAVYAALPGLAGLLAPVLAERLGLTGLVIELDRPGLRGVNIHRLLLTGGRVTVDAGPGYVEYRLVELLRGRAGAIRFDRLEVQVAGEDAGAASPPAVFPAIDPGQWFAALPVERVEVRRLDLLVPAVGFAGSGGLALDSRKLEVALTGSAPAAAAGWSLRIEADRSGSARLRVTEQSRIEQGRPRTPAPLFDLRLGRNADSVDLAADLRLSGFALDLVAALLDLPAGAGSIAGSVATGLPWPLPAVPDWRGLDLRGDLAVAWMPRQGDWALGPLSGRWTMLGGVLTGGLAGTVTEAGDVIPLSVQASGLDLSGEFPHGGLHVAIGPEARPRLQLEAGLGDGRATLTGTVKIAERDWLRLGRLTGWLPGRGAATAKVSAALPWTGIGLPDLLTLTAEAAISALRWSPGDGAPDVELGPSTLRLAGRALAGELTGRALFEPGELPVDSGAVPPAVDALRFGARLRTGDLLAQPLLIDGTVSGGALGPLDAELAYDQGTGALRVRLAGAVELAAPLMAGLLEAWSAPWDLDAGRLAVVADLGWPATDPSGGSGSVTGRVELTLGEASAHYAEYRLAGMAGTFVVSLAEDAWRMSPVEVRAERVAMGIELTDLSARIAASPRAVEVERITARIFGGSLATGAFEFEPVTASAVFDVRLAEIDLAQVLALYGERIAGTGLLDGSLPVTVADGAASIRGGRLVARPPGGMIRVAPEITRITGQPGLDFALRALGNFTYTELGADLDYAASGDLSLAVALRGRNPDVEGGRPIHYNLNVTENVPQLLESLTLDQHLIRAIERRVAD